MKKILLVIVILVTSLDLQSQNIKNNKSWILDYEPLLNTPAETNVIYQGRDYVKLIPGFKYNSVGTSNNFIGRINDNLICTTVYGKQDEYDNTVDRNIKTNLPVGSLSGESNVSPNGAFTYNIPIFTPPGTNGVQPGVSLVYNSQSGNGLVGWGWNLSGQSAISRTPQNKFTDNVSKEIQFHKTDKLSIDGNRLVEVGGTAGENYTEYFTEVGNTIKVIPHNSSTQGYEWFEVQGKDGSTIEYGHSTDSRIVTSKGVISWLINKVTDKNGNYILYNYLDDESVKYIHTISYTGNDLANLEPYAKVQFIYDERPDKNISYIGGIAMKSNLILAEIKVKFDEKGDGNFNTEKKYSLKYVQNEYPQLYSVTEHSKTGEALNPTILNYDYENKTELEFTVKKMGYYISDESNSYFGDFNGDGIKDRLVVTRAANDMADWDLLLGVYFDCQQEDCGNEGYQTPVGGKFQFTTVDYKATYGHKLLRENIIVADVNNDGFDDVIIPYLDGYSDCFVNEDDMNTPFFNLRVKVYISNGNNLDLAATYFLKDNRLINFDYGNINEVFIPGDFDGDGYLEIIVKTQQLNYNHYGGCYFITRDSDNGNADYANAWYFKLTDENGIINTTVTYQPIITGHADEKLQIIPFNAVRDNKTELLVITTDNYEGVYQIRNSAGQTYWEKVPDIDALKTYDLNSEERYNFGDFNGDGYSDILFRENNDTAKWKIKYWTGNDFSQDYIMTEMGNLDYDRGFYNYQFSLQDLTTSLADRSKGVFFSLNLADYNGDGKTDILTYERIDKYSCVANPNYWCTSNPKLIREWHDTHFHDYVGATTQETTTNSYIETDLKYNLYSIIGVSETDVIYNKLEKNVNGIDRNTYNNYLLVEEIVKNDNLPLCQSLPSVSDFNGDVNADLFNYKNNDVGSGSILSVYTNKINTQLISISDGYGNKTDINYNVITKPIGIYSNPTPSNYPLRSILSHIYVASDMDNYRYKEVLPYQSLSYQYGLGLSHVNKGFLGFKSFTCITKLLDLSENYFETVNEMELDNIKYNLNPHNTTTNFHFYISDVEDPNFGWNIREKSMQNIFTGRKDLNDSKRYFYYQSKIEDFDYLKNTTQFKTLTYDNYDNILVSETKYKSETNPLATNKTEFTYSNAGAWCYSKPTNIKVTKTHKDDIDQNNNLNESTIETTYEYEIDNYRLKKVKNDPSKGKYAITEFEYDVFGNVTRTKMSEFPATISVREFSKSFDNRGRFCLSETNNSNYLTENKYNQIYGKIIESKDVKGLISKFEHDNFGREKKKISPLGLVTNVNYEWSISLSNPKTMYKIETTQDNAPSATVYFNSLGSELKSEKESFNGNIISTEQTYYQDGKLYSKTYPYIVNSSEPKRFTYYHYDEFSRQIAINNNGFSTFIEYDNQLTTTTTPDGKTLKKFVDDLGNTYKTSEITTGIENTVNFIFNCDGNPKEIKTVNLNTPNGFTITTEYDDYGNKKKLIDPDAGTYQYINNTFGELIEQTEPNGNKDILFYDKLGRCTLKELRNPTGNLINKTEYEYILQNNNENGAGNTKKNTLFDAGNNIINKNEFFYDNYGRITQKDEYVGSQKFTWYYSYNQFGKISSETNPSGVKISYIYDNIGFLIQVKRIDNTHNDIVWELISKDEFGKTLEYKLAGGRIKTQYSFDEDYEFPTGILTKIDNNNDGTYELPVQDLQYNFDYEKGNLISRSDNKNNQWETFEYDDLSRLTSYAVNNNTPVTLSYYNDGSIENKSDVGDYYYTDGVRENPPHAVKKIPEGTNNFNQLKQNITYNAFNRPEELKMMDGLIVRNKAVYSYGHDKERRKVEYFENGNLSYTKYYLGNYEKIVRADNSIKEITYINANGIVAAVIKGEDSHNPNEEQIVFIHTDYQGSIQSFTRESEIFPGEYELIAEFAFNPWGKMRVENDWTNYYTDESFHSNFELLERGYIGQEHLSKFGLINLNARLYDPSLGQFIGSDNFVQNPENPQNYNRYSYCFNNPLKYTDASGNFVAFIMPILYSALVSSSINLATQAILVGKFDFGSLGTTFATNILTAGFSYVSSFMVTNVSKAVGNNTYGIITKYILRGMAAYGTAALSSLMRDAIMHPNATHDQTMNRVVGDGLVALGISGIISAYEFFDWDIKTIEEQNEYFKKEMNKLINSTVQNANQLNGGKGIEFEFVDKIENNEGARGQYQGRLVPKKILILKSNLLIKDYALFIGAHEVEHLRLDIINTATNPEYTSVLKNWNALKMSTNPSDNALYDKWNEYFNFGEEILANKAGRNYVLNLHSYFYRALHFYSPYGKMTWIP